MCVSTHVCDFVLPSTDVLRPGMGALVYVCVLEMMYKGKHRAHTHTRRQTHTHTHTHPLPTPTFACTRCLRAL